MGQPNDLNAAAMVAAAATATATATASVVALRDRNDQYGQVRRLLDAPFYVVLVVDLVKSEIRAQSHQNAVNGRYASHDIC